MKEKVIVFALIILFFGCGTVKKSSKEYQPVTVKQLLEEPFGKDENVKSLKRQFAKDVKIKRVLRRNIHDSQKVDTIFQFYNHKSEVFVYKTYFNREMLIGGVIYNDKFPMINGLTPGISRDDFYKTFIDLKPERSDSVILESKELMRKINFIFNSKGTLKKISFSMYVD